MINIERQTLIILTQYVDVDYDLMINNDEETKALREQYVCGMAVRVLRDAGHDGPLYFESRKPPYPDLMTFDADGNDFCAVEVTDAILPGRLRSREYKERREREKSAIAPSGEKIFPEEDPFCCLRDAIRAKFKKFHHYDIASQQNSWLLVWYTPSNIQAGEAPWDENVIREVQTWSAREDAPILESSPFKRILVLNTSGRAMVQLFPTLQVIRGEFFEESWA